MKYIQATYHIETPYSLEHAAEAIAGEQSTGTFVKLPGETDELRERFRARVVSIKEMGTTESPSLQGSGEPIDRRDKTYQRAEVKIEWPIETVGVDLTTVMSTICGNLYELKEFSGLKCVDLELPDHFSKIYPGPAFGIKGTRELTGVYDRPVIGTIVKPSVGLAPEQTAELVQTLADSGIDFIKDDELMNNPPHSPMKERVSRVMDVINRHSDKTGKKVMYAFNISGEIDTMLKHHDLVRDAGGTCVMVSLNSVGIAGVSHLRKHCELPIHAHRNGWGMYTRHPLLGISFKVYQKIWRTAGVDHIHVNGLRNKYWEPDDSVLESISACMKPLYGAYPVMPVVSSGQWAGQAPDTYRQTGSVDLMYLCGGGIMAHPGGPAAGLTSLHQAWQAAVEGIDLQTYAKTHRELADALKKFS